MPIPKVPAYPKELSKAQWEKTKGTIASLANPAKLKLISDGLGFVETQLKTLDPKVLAALEAAETFHPAQVAAKALQNKIKSIAALVANIRKFAPEAKRISDELAKGATSKGTAKTVLLISQKATEYAKAMEAFAMALDLSVDAVLKLALPDFTTVMGNGKLRAALKEWSVRDQRAPEVFNFLEFYEKGVKAENATVCYQTFIDNKTAKFQINTGGDVTNGLAKIWALVAAKADPKEQVQVWKDNWGVAEKLFAKAAKENKETTLLGEMFPRFLVSKYLWVVIKP